MANKRLLGTLVDLGLTEPEAEVYLAALALGPTTVLALARASGLRRTTIYSVIERLQKRGLLVREVHGFKTRFVAESPEKLSELLEDHRRKLEETLPEFQTLFNLKTGDSTIRFYEGLVSVKHVYEQLLKDVRPHDDYLVVSDLRRWLDQDETFFQKFIERRAKLPLKIRMLTLDSPIARAHKKREKNYNESIKILPASTKLSTNLVIIPKKVVIHQVVPPIFAMVLENQNIVQMHREQFEIMWRSLP